MTAAGRAGTVAGMRFARGSAGGCWRSGAVQDACLAAALLLAAELEIVLNGLGSNCAAVAALATVPLAVRRQLPTVSFACVAVLAPTLDRVLGSPWGQNANALVFLILVASYSVAAHAPLRRSLPTVLGAGVWLAALDAVWGDGQDYAFVVLLLGVPWLSGRGVRRYRQRAARLRGLASRLERERAVSGRVAIARERQRMAHETHDAIGHAVGEMVLQASGAQEVLDSNPRRARTALNAVEQTGRDAVEQLRGVLGMLRSGDEPSLPGGSDEMALDIAAVPRRRSFPASLDVAVAFILFVVGARYAFAAVALAGQRVPALLLQMLAASAVAFRGSRPIVALSLAVAAYAGEALLVDGDPGSPATIAALLITIYSAAVRATRLGAVAVAALALATPAAIAVAIAGDDAADVLLPVTILGVPWLAGRAVAAYQRQGEELSALAQRLARERDERARLAVLDERGRVARELHDSVAHAVSVMVLQAGGAEQLLDTEPERARAAVRTIQDVGRDALDQLGTLLGLLQPTDDGPPLAPRRGLADLERLLATVRRAGLPVRLTTLGEPQPLPVAVDAAAYRVIQEALTNALKHSGGAATEITVRYIAEGVQLDIVDAGPRAPRRGTAGHGLAGMRERVGHHGGRLQVGPAVDGPGFAVSAFLPYTPTPPVDPERVHA